MIAIIEELFDKSAAVSSKVREIMELFVMKSVTKNPQKISPQMVKY